MKTTIQTIARLIAAATLGGAFLLGTQGCSVKEDRRPCPCYINLAFPDRAEDDTKPVGVLGWSGGELIRETIIPSEHQPYWVKTVRKGMVTLSAWEGADNARVTGQYVLIPPGFQCDSLYSWHQDVDATGESVYADARLIKQFCRVTVDLKRNEQVMRDFSFLAEGNTCGYDLLSFDAMPGIYRYEPKHVEGESTVSFLIPRQLDESLALSVWFEGDFIATYPLGMYIARMGYDWKAEELGDITVVIDLILGYINIEVAGWEEGAVYQFIEQ